MDTIDIKLLECIELLEENPMSKEITHKEIGLINREKLRFCLNILVKEGYIRGTITKTNSGPYTLKDYSLREKGKQVLLNKRIL